MFRIVAILLLLSLSFQCLVKLGVVAWYEVNKSYVSQTLCENRDKPQMRCHGKCYLKKQLAKTGNSEDQSKNKTEQSSQLTIDFIICDCITLAYVLPAAMPAENGFYSDFATESVLHSVFHPPAFAA
ncbi:hypothetical protein [Polluticoccus soli]|uniref:hypothetical protein n=1 Tax=Polluticoccus soli TaxID=3034150 RepID=UPI0023E179E8|nr:hypothetical protein [Flavipsychrobacter sp. JY13-12]